MCSNLLELIVAGFFLFPFGIILVFAPLRILKFMTRLNALFIRKLLDDKSAPPSMREELFTMRTDPEATAQAVPRRLGWIWYVYRTLWTIGTLIVWVGYLLVLFNELIRCYA
jgi:Na+-transporting methylmalonyl-CoA/oxaloacetate decarboxylase gamma subunit